MEQKLALALHALDVQQGMAHRIATDCREELAVALQALRKGRTDVAAERIEYVFDALVALTKAE